MAIKYYGYYLKGNKVAIAQRDTTDTSSTEYGMYKSPTEDVLSGVEIEYTSSPIYRQNQPDNSLEYNAYSNGWFNRGGYLAFIGSTNTTGNGVRSWADYPVTSGTEGSVDDATDDYILVTGSNKWNGLHRVQVHASSSTSLTYGGMVVTYTKIGSHSPGITGGDLDINSSNEVFDGGGSTNAYLGDIFQAGDSVFITGAGTDYRNNGLFNISEVTPHVTDTSSKIKIDNKIYLPDLGASTSLDTETEAAVSMQGYANGATGGGVSIYKIHRDICQLHFDIELMQDETFELDLTSYQSKAVIFYLQAKMAEAKGNLEIKEYFMAEFKKQVEKERDGRKRGPYIAQGNSNMRVL